MSTKDKVSQSAHRAFDKLVNATHKATDAIGEKGENLINAERKLMKDCRGYVRDNPLSALGIAGGGLFVKPPVEPILLRS